MDEQIENFYCWLRENGQSATWAEVEQRFKEAFPNDDNEMSGDRPRLRGLLLANRRLPLYGRTA